ncbi:MAG: c-type cytochrome [Pseudolabrys sp.]
MSTRDKILGVLLASVTVSGVAFAQTMPVKYGFGSPVTEQELSKYFSIPADGRGLPPGSGNATVGAKLYAENCAACHGEKLEGNPAKGIGGDKLIGGRGSLATKTPVKTVESYWPYATTLFDYVKRAMPFNSPGTLKDDETYAVVAYILSQAKIIQPTETMDARTLPKVAMPNRDGFEPDPRPELELYR